MKEIKVSNVFSHGIAYGPVFIPRETSITISKKEVKSKEEIAREIERFKDAAAKVTKSIAEKAETNPILAGHVAMVNDFTLHDLVVSKIERQHANAEKATNDAIEELYARLKNMDDDYMKERAADIKDIGTQLIAALQNRSDDKFSGLHVPSIIVAKDLLPSDTACMNKKLILGFITEEGGITSHVSIMAKSLNIPALVGVAGILDIIQSCDTVFMDADNGDIYINPEPDAAKELEQKLQQSRKIQIRLLENAKKPAITKDGKQLKVYANVGNLNDVEQAARLDVDGIGLFRTEFLYMQSDHFPTENEQFEVYKKAVQILNREIVIRTLDIGGDKKLNYYTFPKEENPFLGCRAIRFCLGHPEIFKTQLRAILRASIFGPLRIMLPMIVSVEEAEKALALLEEAKQELRDRNQQFEENIPVGMMIETPAAVECAEEFAEMMDFFSIGTNDLTQYMLATDRGNKKLVDLYNPYNPAVLRAIARVIEAGHKAGIEVGMCGEFASRPKAVTLLLGLGLDEFSMSASDIPMIKDAICKSDYKKAKEIVPNILQMRHAGEIKKALESSLSKEL